MNNFIRIKNIVIVMLCITVIAMATGYIILSLKLESVRNETSTFKVSFSNIKKVSSIKGGTKEPLGELSIDSTGKIISMNFILYNNHDEIDYEITVKNEGNMNASLMDLILTPDFEDTSIMKLYHPVSLTVSKIGGRILEPGEEATIQLSIFYNSIDKSLEQSTKKITGKIGLVANSYEEE